MSFCAFSTSVNSEITFFGSEEAKPLNQRGCGVCRSNELEECPHINGKVQHVAEGQAKGPLHILALVGYALLV